MKKNTQHRYLKSGIAGVSAVLLATLCGGAMPVHKVPDIPALSPSRARARPSAPGKIRVSYTYPPQRGLASLKKCDPHHTKLTDGRPGTGGPTAVWGAWGVKPLVVDWTFSRPVCVRAMRVAIVHPSPGSDNSAPCKVELFGGLPGKKYSADPELTLPIPFQNGRLEMATLLIPGRGLVVRRLRTRFVAAHFQTVLAQVSFRTRPASRGQLHAARLERVRNEPTPLKPVKFLPAATVKASPPPPVSIFGVAGHMIQTDLFFPDQRGVDSSRYWRLSYTLPFLRRLGATWVREPLYQPWFFGTKRDGIGPYKTSRAACRKVVERYLSEYDGAGVRLILCPMFSRAGRPGFGSYFRWIGQLAAKYPCVAGVEMSNEPNLTGFWRYGVKDYVEAARRGARDLRRVAPKIPIIVGGFSGWGGGLDHPKLKAQAKGSGDLATVWARKAFADGLLDFADGVSVHPYRQGVPPEGGTGGLESPANPHGFTDGIRAFWRIVQQYNVARRPLKLYFTEIGYSASTGGYSSVGTTARQADYLSRMMLILFNLRLSGFPLRAVCWYDLKRDDRAVGNYESNFGLVSPKTSHVRPAFVVYQHIIHAFADTGNFQLARLTVRFTNLPRVIKYYVWRRKSDGSIVVPFWRMNQLQKHDRNFDSELILTLPEAFGTPECVRLVSLHSGEPHAVGYRVSRGKLYVPLRVTARAAWLVIYPSRDHRAGPGA